MRTSFSIAFAIVFALVTIVTPAGSPVAAQSTSATSGDIVNSIQIDGTERTYRVHLPGGIAPAAGAPVLIVLHGGGGNGKQVDHAKGISDLADQEGFIAVYPNGSGRTSKLLTWNAYNCCAYAHAQDIDDVAFISALIDRVIADYDVDPTRIYITGHSNGAMMTFRLACELSDKIAAAAPYAGALNTDSCSPDSPVPMLIMNGADDTSVLVSGGTGSGIDDTRVDQPTSFAVDTWVAADGCTSAPIETDDGQTLIKTWTACSNGSVVEQVLIRDWGHNWPTIESGAPFDATRVIWDFVSQFSKTQIEG